MATNRFLLLPDSDSLIKIKIPTLFEIDKYIDIYTLQIKNKINILFIEFIYQLALVIAGTHRFFYTVTLCQFN